MKFPCLYSVYGGLLVVKNRYPSAEKPNDPIKDTKIALLTLRKRIASEHKINAMGKKFSVMLREASMAAKYSPRNLSSVVIISSYRPE